MLKKPSLLGKEAGKYLLIGTMTGLLVGCGGSSGDADTDIPIDEQDFDLDGLLNGIDDDADGDFLIDAAFGGDDNFVDLDSDGLDDITGLTEAEAEAEAEPEPVIEVSAENPCGGENGTDNDSSTAGWEDNCVVKRATVGGQFATSLFAVGIQRVLYCSEFKADSNAADYTGFADGIFGANSEQATIDFQDAESLLADGKVGPATWPRLQERVEELVTGDFDTPDAMGFTTGPCAGITLFYQETSPAADSLSIIRGAWTLARNQPNQLESVPFSWEPPEDRL